MKEELGKTQRGKSKVYEISLEGHLDEHWSEWFDDLMIAYDEEDNTILSGPITDQPALYGLLKKVHGLGLSLISVKKVEYDAGANRPAKSKEGGTK